MNTKIQRDWFALDGAIDVNGHYFAVQLPDGRWLCIEPMTFQRARLCVTEVAGARVEDALDRGWCYGEIWEFETVDKAFHECVRRLAGRHVMGWLRHHSRLGEERAPRRVEADPRD